MVETNKSITTKTVSVCSHCFKEGEAYKCHKTYKLKRKGKVAKEWFLSSDSPADGAVQKTCAEAFEDTGGLYGPCAKDAQGQQCCESNKVYAAQCMEVDTSKLKDDGTVNADHADTDS